ncbi:MAG: Crp/Fnr family transcriptional regulator [Clostridia bacterium]|nr:Crp/Fnr family transcriptional regulator [Clostridia bacterium]
MDIEFLRKSIIFRNMTDDDIALALASLHTIEKEYKKGDMIMSAGAAIDSMGLVLTGSVTIETNDIWGNRTILSHVGNGGFFAETYALLDSEVMLVDVCANENCRILFLRIGSLSKFKFNNTTWGSKLIFNMLQISVHKNLTLSLRSFHTAPKNVRGRIMAYLNSVSLQNGSQKFDIPFNRQQMADYLNLDRTALSKELGRMQKDGVISFWKNHFNILE